MTTIRQLPDEVRSYLRSGVTVTSVTQCVEELLLNSLDAGATCVAVRVDLDLFKIQVVDNGTGVPQDQLKLMGERYATSKCHSMTDLQNLQYFGYRGEALASIRESCSILEIITKIKDSSKTYCKLFQDGRPLEVIESMVPRPSVGTTVTVHDLFSKFPVRRKSTNLNLELERIRQRVEGLALMKPAVSISFRNDSTGVILVQTHKSNSSLLTFKHLFGAAKASTLVEVKDSKGYFTIEGFLGKEGHSKKELQFVYVNGRLVLKTSIHKMVNKMLTNSAIFKTKYGSDQTPQNAESKSVFVKSPGRQIERYPVFLLNIKCSLTKYDITFDPAKTLIEFKDWDSLLELTKEIINTFLKKENLTSEADVDMVPKNGKLSAEKERESRTEKDANIPLSKAISPSTMKDTLFSKTVKRKSSEPDLFKTPISITIEEWKAGNKTRKVVHTDSSSQNISDSSQIETDQSESKLDESSEPSGNSQQFEDVHRETGKAVTSPENNCSSPTIKVKEIGKTVLTDFVRNSCDNNEQLVNEKGDNNICKIATNNGTSNNLTEIGHTKELHEEEPSRMKVSESAVVVSSKSSLSEFRKIVGKPATSLNKPVSVDEKLKAHLSLNNDVRGGDRIYDQVTQSAGCCLQKYTSSLQKFKKNIPSHSASSFKSDDGHVHHTTYTNNSEKSKASSLQRKDIGRLCRSGISFVDSSSEHVSDEDRNRNDDDKSNDFQSLPANNFSANRNHSASAHGNVFSSSNSKNEKYAKDVHVGSNIPCQNRKRHYACNEIETVASKLSRLSKQKTATISVPSACGSTEIPCGTEITCGVNAVISVVKNTEPYTSGICPPPSFTQTASLDSFSSMSMFDQCAEVRDSKLNDFFTGESQISEGCDTYSKTQNKLLERGNLDETAYWQMSNINGAEINEIDSSENISCTLQSKCQGSCKPFAYKYNDIPVNDNNRACETLPCLFDNVSSVNNGVISTNLGISFEASAGDNFEIINDSTHKGLSSSEIGNTASVTDTEHFTLSTQGFSPQMDANQTGLSQKMTAVSISQDLNSKDRIETPFMMMSPCSGGFSPCLSVTPKSLPDCLDGDSQGFTTYSKEAPTAESKEKLNQFEDIASSEGSNSQCTIIWDKDAHMVQMDFSSERNPEQSHSNTTSSERAGQSEKQISENRSMIKSMSVSEYNSEDIIVSDKSLRISQMLFTASENETPSTSSEENIQINSEDIHFSDIFSPTISDKAIASNGKNQTQDLEIVCLQNYDTMQSDKNRENNRDVGKEIVASEDQGDDTLLLSTPDNAEVFSSWDGSLYDTVSKLREVKNVKSQNEIEEKDTGIPMCKSVEEKITETSGITDRKTVHDLESANRLVQMDGCSSCDKEQIPHVQTVLKETLEIGVNLKTTELVPKNNSEKHSSDHGLATDSEQRKWIQLKDPQTGKKIYVHSLVGTTVTEDQWKVSQASEAKQEDVTSDRVRADEDNDSLANLTPNTTETLHNLMAKHLSEDNDDADNGDDDDEEDSVKVKWRDSHMLTDTVSNKGSSSVEDLFTGWSNPVFNSSDKDVLNMEINSFPKSTVKAYRALHSCKFTKEMLNTVKVIGQVDKKFIACLMKTDPSSIHARPDMLAVIDQHAAHERIRLELLTEEAYVDCDVDSGELEVYKVDPPKCLELTADEIRIVTSYKQEFNRIGVKFDCEPQSRTSIKIETIPACIMEKDVNYVKSMREAVAWNIVQALIKEHVDLLVSTGGAGKRFPTILHKALCSQACHGAIKFGDNLSHRECEALIRDLSRCDLPFQCAHGRPSVMPVLQLEQLTTKLPQEKRRKPQLYKLSNAIQGDSAAKE